MRTRLMIACMLAALVACKDEEPERPPTGGEGDGVQTPPEDPEQVVIGLVTRERRIMMELERAEGMRRVRLERELESVQQSLAPRLAERPGALSQVLDDVEDDMEQAQPGVRAELETLAEDLRTQQTRDRLDPETVRELLERRERLHHEVMTETRLPYGDRVPRPELEPHVPTGRSAEPLPHDSARPESREAIEPRTDLRRVVEPIPTQPQPREPSSPYSPG